MGKYGACIALCLRPVTEWSAPILPFVPKVRAWVDACVWVGATSLVDRQQARGNVQASRWVLREVPKPYETQSRALSAAAADGNDVGDDDQIGANLFHLETEHAKLGHKVDRRHCVTSWIPASVLWTP